MTIKKMFASDLDQTLIYSYRSFINENIEEEIKPVEWFEDRYISYMTERTLSKLQQLSRELVFVPVTTRTKLQYERINFCQYDISYEYAVTSNGGRIFHRGIEDPDWMRRVSAGRKDCLAFEDLIAKFNEIRHSSWVHEDSGKLADDLFFYCLIEREMIPAAELAAFKLWAKDNNWELSVQGRKLYLVPFNVNKAAAIQYIRAKEGIDQVVAAGDSLLDLDMLIAADFAIAPAHGELYSQYLQKILGLEKIGFTKKSGINAGEEILNYVAEPLSQESVV
ncbi:MAG TPA: haloacid dehalogenase [Desulfosporosinus sp.]|nr:haloacid dehalogenase [Desulfosporosinus sp.]